MKTSKPISTISYNTIPFLKDVLNRLKYLGLINYWEFIKHIADVDDKKDHIHLYIQPNKPLDTLSLEKYFIEVDPNNLDKPLKTIFFVNTKDYGDWYWYGLHNKDYLKAKHLERNFNYSDADIYSSDIDTHNYLVYTHQLLNYANMSDIAMVDAIINAVSDGKDLQWLLNNEKVPLGKISYVIQYYNAYAGSYGNSNLKESVKNNVFPSPENIKNIKYNQILSSCTELTQDELIFDD